MLRSKRVCRAKFNWATSLLRRKCWLLRSVLVSALKSTRPIKFTAHLQWESHSTVPRSELTATLVSTKVSSVLRQEFDYRNVNEAFWTDSQVFSGYIRNDARQFHVFVANRVQQIRDSSSPSQWQYVRTEENPADEISRGEGWRDHHFHGSRP